MKRQSGFTLLEVLVTILILGILAGIAVPRFAVWLPNYRLKSAALDVYSNFQLAKLRAVRANASHSVVFNTGNNRYTLVDGDGNTVKTVDLSQYDEQGGIRFGFGNATKNATNSGGALPGTPVTYGGNSATFNSRGMGNAGYVYLENTKGTAYALGTESSGLIKMKKWIGGDWK